MKNLKNHKAYYIWLRKETFLLCYLSIVIGLEREESDVRCSLTETINDLVMQGFCYCLLFPRFRRITINFFQKWLKNIILE